MESWDLLPNIWYVLIGVLLAGYSILDGFDLGIGILLPFLGKKEEEKEALLRAIGPFWDGNEVWLLTAGGALFAAYPHAYATVFSGFYLALMIVLFALIFRAVSLEFRAHDRKRKRLWEGTFILGSFLPALLYGVALGNLVKGIPLDERMEYTGNFFTLINPFGLIIGLFGFVAFLLQGASFVILKTEGALRERAKRLAGIIWAVFVALLILSLMVTLYYLPGSGQRLGGWVFGAVVAVSLAGMSASWKKNKDGLAFIFSSEAFLGLWGIIGAIQYPNLVRASGDPSLSLTITNASSSELTLKVMLIIVLIGMPIVVGYTIFVYRVFRGKVRVDTLKISE